MATIHSRDHVSLVQEPGFGGALSLEIDAWYVVACACGFESLALACPRFSAAVADLHARDCDAEPMLPIACETCGDGLVRCPRMHAAWPSIHGTAPLSAEHVLAGGCLTLAV
ncbi:MULTISPECIES: hypothetical protein [unclassified Streptomyces]|uniref:hypothetical protein n=1 Tax=unclassified Streptomyces TaxID=2593676 RepID=UPI00089509B9|nr:MULTISPECIES: hypothetical protein [unclassified Streptomyces]PBC84611.1 hypothetical protein BX261_4605 [Streptomyces sp. 2321.6]SED37847.1 hypothetical protein SAMN05428940_4633 [Streptomyces sp. 2133.1]